MKSPKFQFKQQVRATPPLGGKSVKTADLAVFEEPVHYSYIIFHVTFSDRTRNDLTLGKYNTCISTGLAEEAMIMLYSADFF